MKRDLRIQDHAPLHAAENASLPYLIIFLFEPSLISYPDTSLRHLQFQYHSIKAINEDLKDDLHKVEIFYAEAFKVFDFLKDQFQIQNIFSYQESGIEKTWIRDKKIKIFCKKNNIHWIEFERDAIRRGIQDRDGWDKYWYVFMSQPAIQNEYSKNLALETSNPFPIPDSFFKKIEIYPKVFQPAGSKNAFKYLKSFVKGRGLLYSKHISKPLESRTSCGRVSPYLAWGNISVKQVYQFIKNHPDTKKRPFNSFLTRLKWRSHFIQKFEVECSYEHTCINLGYELLERQENKDFIEAWKSGNTGFPLVDACMRCVRETGWINFRMRAMVVSLLCHHLDQDWRSGAHFLAQKFLDYEPGIHYPQFQMQAGTTGINTIRMYNPIKQSKDHDPSGVFIKKWIPALKNVAQNFIHEPWKMTAMEQNLSQIKMGDDYPNPIVNLEESGKIARQKIWGHRKHPKVKTENYRIIKMHTRGRKGAS